MSELCRFHGIVISIYGRDHNPPHIHVRHGGDKAWINIDDPDLMHGRLSLKSRQLVTEWTRARRAELQEAWDQVRLGQEPGKIAPLD